MELDLDTGRQRVDLEGTRKGLAGYRDDHGAEGQVPDAGAGVMRKGDPMIVQLFKRVIWNKNPWNQFDKTVTFHNKKTGRIEKKVIKVKTGRKGRYGFHPKKKEQVS